MMVRREIPLTKTEIICDICNYTSDSAQIVNEGKFVCDVCRRDVCFKHTFALCQPHEYHDLLGHDSSGLIWQPYWMVNPHTPSSDNKGETRYAPKHIFCIECTEKLKLITKKEE